MAVRTNATNVKAVLLSLYDLVNTPDLTAFISEASLLVDWVDSCDTDNLNSTALLTVIETNLAAHFYLLADRAASDEKTLDASVKYQGQTEMYLKSTPYGQKAISLDVSGCLASRDLAAVNGGKRTVKMTWLGKAPSAQTAYVDRD